MFPSYSPEIKGKRLNSVKWFSFPKFVWMCAPLWYISIANTRLTFKEIIFFCHIKHIFYFLKHLFHANYLYDCLLPNSRVQWTPAIIYYVSFRYFHLRIHKISEIITKPRHYNELVFAGRSCVGVECKCKKAGL